MVKSYLIKQNYLEAFLNMVTLGTVHSIHVTPSGYYNVICTHSPMQAMIYLYAYRVFTGEVTPVSEESSGLYSFVSFERQKFRAYDTIDALSQEEQDLLVECFKVLMPEAECVFLSDRKFKLVVKVD